MPLLQAEEDRDQVRRHLADQAREKELMGKNTKVYHSDRYVHSFILMQILTELDL
jgi:NADH dehydrogenase (ubiquinone) 1 alpha subcomplex subunit 13